MNTKILIGTLILIFSLPTWAKSRCETFLTPKDSAKAYENLPVAQQEAQRRLNLVLEFLGSENSIQLYYTRPLSTESYALQSRKWEMLAVHDHSKEPTHGEVMILHTQNNKEVGLFQQSRIGKLEAESKDADTQDFYLEPLMSLSNVSNQNSSIISNVSATKDTLLITYTHREHNAARMNEHIIWKYQKVSDGRLLLTTESYTLSQEQMGVAGEKQVSTILLTPIKNTDQIKPYLDIYFLRGNTDIN